MAITYEYLQKWIEEYFTAFNTYGQSPDTVHRMDEYFAPDFEFRPYVATITPVKGREEWYKVVTSHPSGYEKLTPEDILIDERRMLFAARIKAQILDSKTRELLVEKRYFANYPLELDKDGKLKVKRLEFFWEVLPAGAMEIDDVFFRDWKATSENPEIKACDRDKSGVYI